MTSTCCGEMQPRWQAPCLQPEQRHRQHHPGDARRLRLQAEGAQVAPERCRPRPVQTRHSVPWVGRPLAPCEEAAVAGPGPVPLGS